MSFKTKKYTVIRKTISKDLASFLANYFSMKRQVYDTCRKANYISPFDHTLGIYEPKNEQIPDTYSHYADVAMETLMLKCQPAMEKATGLRLYPAYTYTRLYKKGDELTRHKDRFSCEISTTMNLGGDPWPIYLSPDENVGIPDGKKITTESKAKGIKIDLSPGDMLVYSGCELEHWRKPFIGEECVQVFLHYNNSTTPGSQQNMFDKRPHLGLPGSFRKCKNS
jgi:hypothetical protein|tara:strand:- start:830 stop:1501 length:672 start_codon:yes stop_codon:yes gene_type:complete